MTITTFWNLSHFVASNVGIPRRERDRSIRRPRGRELSRGGGEEKMTTTTTTTTTTTITTTTTTLMINCTRAIAGGAVTGREHRTNPLREVTFGKVTQWKAAVPHSFRRPCIGRRSTRTDRATPRWRARLSRMA